MYIRGHIDTNAYGCNHERYSLGGNVALQQLTSWAHVCNLVFNELIARHSTGLKICRRNSEDISCERARV